MDYGVSVYVEVDMAGGHITRSEAPSNSSLHCVGKTAGILNC